MQGRIADVRQRRRKGGSFFELCVRGETETEIVADELPSTFWSTLPYGSDEKIYSSNLSVKPSGRRLRHTGQLHEFSADLYRRAEVRRMIKDAHRMTKPIGSKRSLVPDYLIRRFPPYAPIDSEKLARVELPSFQPRWMTLDIETYNKGGVFPDPESASRPIMLISATYGGVTKLYSGNEKQILEELFHDIVAFDPDFIFGLNSDSYDWPFIAKRSEKNGVPTEIGRDGSGLKRRIASSTIRGITFYYHAFGRQNIDVMHVLKRWSDLPSGNQDDATRIVLREEPMHVDKGRLWEYADTEDPDVRAYWEEYSERDAAELYRICEKLGLPQVLIEISRRIRLFPEQIARRKFKDLAYHYVNIMGYRGREALPDPPNFFAASPKNLRTVSVSPGRYAAHEFDRRVIYPFAITAEGAREDNLFRRNKLMPVVWAAKNALKFSGYETGEFSPPSTFSRFWRGIDIGLFDVLNERRYLWHDEEAARYVQQVVEGMEFGFFSDRNVSVSHNVPDLGELSRFMNQTQVKAVAIDGGKIVYVKDGILYTRGIKLFGRTSGYVARAINEIAKTACLKGPEEALEKLMHYCDAEEMSRANESEFVYTDWLSRPLSEYRKSTRKTLAARRANVAEPYRTFQIDDREMHGVLDYRNCARLIINKVAPFFEAMGISRHSIESGQYSLLLQS